MNQILGQTIPEIATSPEFRNFVISVYHAVGGNYLGASHVLKTDPMTVWRLVNGKQKDSPKLREQWGIHEAYEEVKICPVHGVVHKFDCQKEVVKPKPRPKRKPSPPYFKCRQDDPAQVMRQLEKYYPGEFERKGEYGNPTKRN